MDIDNLLWWGSFYKLSMSAFYFLGKVKQYCNISPKIASHYSEIISLISCYSQLGELTFKSKCLSHNRHESRIKHVVIETKSDPITGVLYHITPHGPFFNSLTGLIEEAKQTCIIQNHMFDVILTKSPPKVSIIISLALLFEDTTR